MEIADSEGLPALVDRARHGDVRAFEALVFKYHADVLRVGFLICGRHGDADDAAQATWCRVWQKLGTLRDPTKVRAWIMVIAANEARQQLRRDQLRRLVRWHRNPEPDIPSDLVDLRNALSRLSPNDRRLLALRHAAGLSSAEIAGLLGAPAGSVRVRLSRLHGQLRRELKG